MKLIIPVLFATAILARDVPDNLRSFINRVKNGKCTGGKVLKDGFYSEYPGSKNYAYCQDNESSVIYLYGEGTNLANMDVRQIDGLLSRTPADISSHLIRLTATEIRVTSDTQATTAFQYQVQQYSGGAVSDLNANFIPYVVFGNFGNKAGYTIFNPQNHGIKPLSVMAVVHGDKLLYGVFGDTNGDDGKPLVGEASISLATQFFGTSITGNNGHDENDVMYIAFPGTIAETVNKNADWGAKNFHDFEASISDLGDKLIQRLS